METKDFRIGDIVKCSGRVVEIAALGNTGICILDTKSTFDSWVTCDNLTPIPITKNILEKNDWVLRKPNVYIRDTKHHSFKITVGEESCEVRLSGYNGSDMYLFNIQYVHELQHMLWMFGINDKIKGV